MGRLYRQKDVHGVKVTYVDLRKVRAVKKVFVTGHRSIWVLLPDGSVGHSDVDFFKYAYIGTQKRDVLAAEALWRLGAIKKDVYAKVEAAELKHREKRDRSYAKDELKMAAQRLGLKLTVAQERALT